MNPAANSATAFNGAAYAPSFDRARLTAQIERIRCYMLGVQWRTLREIKIALEERHAPTVFPESSISAQLRNLKKPPLSYRVEKRRRAGVYGPGAGIWEYRLLPPAQIDFTFSRQNVSSSEPSRVEDSNERDDGRGREEFLRTARRIAGLA